MFKNYLKVAWRNIIKKKGYALINIFGLSVGLGCCIVIILFLIHELTYDRHHPDEERIFRINQYRVSATGEYRILGSAVGTRNDLRQTLELAAAKKLVCHTETYPLEDINEVFARMERGEIAGRAVVTL